MSWNKHEAVSYARSHALTHTGHYCARAIAAAIRAGGLKIEGANATLILLLQGKLLVRADKAQLMQSEEQ